MHTLTRSSSFKNVCFPSEKESTLTREQILSLIEKNNCQYYFRGLSTLSESFRHFLQGQQLFDFLPSTLLTTSKRFFFLKESNLRQEKQIHSF